MLIFFSQETSNIPELYKIPFDVQQLSDFAEWEKNRIVPSAFVIEGNDHPYVSSILGKIRRDSEVFASLCFSTVLLPSSDNSLFDGILPPPLELQKQIEATQDLSRSLKGKDNYLTHQGRLINYLWLRPNYIVQPWHEWKNPRFYRYPLLEAMSLDQSDSFEWLRNLANSKILEPVSLLDRQRECMYCRSSHLSFVDICPNCSSIDIKLQPSLHCFTCGCVDA